MNLFLIFGKRRFSINSTRFTLSKFIRRRQNLSKKWIFQKGELLQAVQMTDVFHNQYIFLQQKLKYPIRDVLDNFYNLRKEYGGMIPPAEAMKSFIGENFENVDSTDPWSPPDWTDEPDILDHIHCPEIKELAKQLNLYWNLLARKLSNTVMENPDLFAAYQLPHGFITNDSDMHTMHYWSSYWIITGVLTCGMFETARGMINNLIYLLNLVGHIPMFSQIYYEGRTNPPMLTFIFDSYLRYTGDFDFIKTHLKDLCAEIEFWDKERSIHIKHKGLVYKFYRYHRKRAGPRPERYREDYALASLGISRQEMLERYIAIQSAVESGWHYSSRWFNFRGDNTGNISDTATQSIIPVDLNAILHKSFVLISKWYKIIGEFELQELYKEKAIQLLAGIEAVLWDPEEGIWLDYDIINKKNRPYFYLSNFAPLWTKSYTFPPEELVENMKEYLNRFFMDKYEGGLPASVEYSGEKWDFPNAWPPLQAYVIQGFDNLKTPDSTNIAFHFADKWIFSVYTGFKQSGKLYEKYDSLLAGNAGDVHSNYETLEGIGWTIGLTFELLERWGPSLKIGFDR